LAVCQRSEDSRSPRTVRAGGRVRWSGTPRPASILLPPRRPLGCPASRPVWT